MASDIRLWSAKTKKGNTVSVFFNTKTNLFVADLIHKNEKGGWEFCRVFLDEKNQLSHCVKKRKEVRENG